MGYPLSWERTFKEIVEAVKKLFGAYQFKSIIIVFSTEGAVIIENNDKTLIFDKTRQEDDWISEKGREGRVFGYASCVLASLVYYEANNNCDKISAIKKGLLAARELHKCGYICKDKSLDFPYESVSKKIKENSSKDNAFSIFKGRGNETILEYALHKKRSNKYELAKQIVEEGIDEALKIKNIYREEIGKWISLDKDEIERVRAIRNIIKVYLKDWPQKKPLSIAVFGPPGSGKSFSIKEILRNSSKDKDNIVIETYNLSQIESPNELTTVFHKIRDIYLNSKIPCFFWDEFDSILNSEQLGWLKHFLAPMQDSNFYQAGFIRPLGAAIFVFAGGTSKTYSEFIESKGLTKKEKQKIKLPDFISRIDGFLDVKGINRNREEYGILGFFTNDDHYIKRAILLRSLLEKKLTKNEDYMDEYVLEKLLKTYEYKFGIRSMEKIIELSHIKDKKRFTISCLPSKSIIKTHIDL
ncbi:MAG: ATP-binding protein [Candidatus Eremiobacteraeota bacterium]|nr:ATP-binding protein [Candidatus Eremiobacteraeota bacterium]